MTRISEKEFARICAGIDADADAICRHNPIGGRAEILLWMLMCCLTSYLNLSEIETPCFTAGAPTAQTYRDAINFILRERRDADFSIDEYLDRLEK